MGEALVGGRSRGCGGSERRIGAGDWELMPEAEDVGVVAVLDAGVFGCRRELSDGGGGCRWEEDRYGLLGMCDGKLVFGNM